MCLTGCCGHGFVWKKRIFYETEVTILAEGGSYMNNASSLYKKQREIREGERMMEAEI